MKRVTKPFLHWRSLLAVGMLTIAFVILAVGFLDTKSNIPGIATTVFQVAGTMVALALPAAQLMGQAMTRVADYWLDVVFRPEIPEQEDAQSGYDDIQEAQKRAVLAWRALGYVLAAFFLSSIALFINPRVVPCSCSIPLVSWFFSIPLIYWLLGLTLSFLLVGSYWFFPVAWWLLNLEALHNTQKILENYKGDAEVKSGQPFQRNPGAVTGTDRTVSPERAREIANAYIANDRRFSPGTKVGEAERFYGYTLHIEKDGEITGMLSVNGYSEKVIYYSFAKNEEA